MNLSWLIPDDRGGGTAAVALSCCRQAARAGHDVTLLMALPPTGHLDEHVENFRLASLGIEGQPPESPQHLIDWLRANPQDVLFLNGCSEIEPAIPHVPASTHCVDVIHDTAATYWQRAVTHEAVLDGIVAVSETVARNFRNRLHDPSRLYVLHNGTVFPPPPDVPRENDLIFLGGSKPFKGAGDVPALWDALVERGFEGRLHWFGGLDDELSQQVRTLPAADRVIDHGRVPRSQIFERAARSRVLLMLSRVEPFGMVTIEAMGMGCLPVAWDIQTGTQEIVEARETGFFAPLGDIDALADQVLHACKLHENRREQAVHTARTRFSEEAMWKRYAGLIDELHYRPVVHRPRAGTEPPDFQPPRRYFQMLPESVRDRVRSFVNRHPQLGYWLRNWRGV